MATPLEDRLLAGRPQPPEFSAEGRNRARMAVLGARSAPAPRGAPWSRAFGRPVRLVAGGLGLAALGGLIALLLVAGPHRKDAATGLRFADRSEGGVALHIRVGPAPGATLPHPAAEQQAVRVLRGRATAQGIAGLEVEANGDGTLDAWVPVARTAEEVSGLLVPTRLRVFDATRDRLAADSNVQKALQRAQALVGPGAGPSEFYLVGRGGGSLLAGPAASRSALIARVGGRVGPYLTVLAVPAGLLLLNDVPAHGWMVVRDRPVLSGTATAGITARSWGLSVALEPEAARLLAARPLGDRLVLTYDQYDPSPPAIVGTLAADATDPARFGLRPPTALRDVLVRNASAGPLGSQLTVLDESPTGPARVRRGARVPQALVFALERRLPTAPGASALRPILGTLLLEAQARTAAFGTWSVVTALDHRGESVGALVAPGGRVAVISGGGVGCQLTPQHPLLSPCSGSGAFRVGAAYGRVDDRVVRVVAEFDHGRRQAAAIANGWWLAVGPVVPRRVFGYDGAGAMVARTTVR